MTDRPAPGCPTPGRPPPGEGNPPGEGDPTGAADVGGDAALIYGRAGVVTFFTLLSRVLGMVRDLTIAHRFGASLATDAWVQAFRVPNALRRLTAEGSMTVAFVPVYVEVREREGIADARAFAQRVLTLVLVVTGLLAALGIAFSEPLTLLTSPGFADAPEKFSLTALLIRWTFPYLVLVSLVAWAMGVLNAEGHYAAPAAAPILLNMGIISAVLWGTGWFAEPVLAIAAGVLVGGMAQVLLQLPALLRRRQPIWPRLDWHDPYLRRLLRLLAPSLLSVAVYELNIIVLGVLASFLPSGQIFYYNNATRLTELVMGLFAFAFATAGLPRLSEHVAREDWAATAATARLTFSAAFFTTLPAMVGLIAAAPAIVAMLYLHGAYTLADVLGTAAALRVLALGMPAVAAVRIMVPVYYALQDSRTPALLSLLGLGVTALLGWFLSQRWEVLGLAAGLSIGTWCYCLAMAWRLRRKARQLSGWFPAGALARQVASSALVGAFAYGIAAHVDWSAGPASPGNWGFLVVVIGGSVALHVVASLALGEPEVRNWLALLRRTGTRLRGVPRP